MKKQKKNILKPNIWQYFKPHKWGISFYVLFYVFACLCAFFETILLAECIELITLKEFSKSINLGFIIIGIDILRYACYHFSNLASLKVSNSVVFKLNTSLISQLFKLNAQTYKAHDTGSFISKATNDPKTIIAALDDLILNIAEFLTSLAIFIYITILNGWIGLCLLSIIIIGYVIERVRIHFRELHEKAKLTENDNLNSLTNEIIQSENDVKSLNLENTLTQTSTKQCKNCVKAQNKYLKVHYNFMFLKGSLTSTLITLTLILGIIFIDKGSLTLAAFLIIHSRSDSIFDLIWRFGDISSNLTDIKISSERMFSLFDEHEFETEKFGNKSIEKVKGNIEFKNVNFTFKDYEFVPPSEQLEEAKKKSRKEYKKVKLLLKENGNQALKQFTGKTDVLKDVSFEIKPNTTIAFVGKSGSGKSTILNLISKRNLVNGGDVLIDGVSVKKLNKETIRKAISLVNQFPYIFNMSIKDNLLLAKENATDEEINEAIEKASLTEFINSLPKGIHTVVGESGVKLSGGQKQRLAIARALLRETPIILFDESTSSLDNITQNDIKKSIDNLKGKSTIVIVAHRLSTIKDVDKIFFLEDCKITDEGTFDELFNRNEKFKTMFLAENI